MSKDEVLNSDIDMETGAIRVNQSKNGTVRVAVLFDPGAVAAMRRWTHVRAAMGIANDVEIIAHFSDPTLILLLTGQDSSTTHNVCAETGHTIGVAAYIGQSAGYSIDDQSHLAVRTATRVTLAVLDGMGETESAAIVRGALRDNTRQLLEG